MTTRERIAEGMTVYSRDGEKLGKVVAADDGGLFVEKGLLFPKEYGFRYDEVDDVRDDGIHLRLDRGAISQALVHDDRGVERHRPPAGKEPPATGEARLPEPGPTGPPGVTGKSTGVGPGQVASLDHPSVQAEGRTLSMVGEGIAPMLVEEEVVVIKEVPPAGTERRAPAGGETRRAASESEEDDHV